MAKSASCKTMSHSYSFASNGALCAAFHFFRAARRRGSRVSQAAGLWPATSRYHECDDIQDIAVMRRPLSGGNVIFIDDYKITVSFLGRCHWHQVIVCIRRSLTRVIKSCKRRCVCRAIRYARFTMQSERRLGVIKSRNWNECERQARHQ